MDEFLTEMSEILEDDVTMSDALGKFESWDSLASLSVMAMADSKFGVKITPRDLNRAMTLEQLYALIRSKTAA
ncbi:Carrier domain-containing protein [Methylorubrum aminovorans]